MKLSLNKDDVATALAEHYDRKYGVVVESVKITPFGENIAEVNFDSKSQWLPMVADTANKE